MSIPVIHTFPLGDYQTNCFVIAAPPSTECWIVDCGYDPSPLLDFAEREKLTPIGLLLTHAHCDHIAGIDEAINRFGKLPISIHEAESQWLENPLLNLSALSGVPYSTSPPDHLLKGGETLELAGTSWRVLYTPGHSPGSVCYIHDESKQALVGDAIFAGSIGRIDFPTSNPDDMRATLELLMTLPDDITIHPGHGPSTTIGRERTSNPFILGGI